MSSIPINHSASIDCIHYYYYYFNQWQSDPDTGGAFIIFIAIAFDLKFNRESLCSPPVPGTKCSRQSLKFCLEMLILRSRVIAEHLMVACNLAKLVQLSHKWNTAVLEIANVIIPKWQIRARHMVETTILQRQLRHQQKRITKDDEQPQQTKAVHAAPTTTTTLTTSIKEDVIEEELEGQEEVCGNEVEISRREEKFAEIDKGSSRDSVESTDEEQTMRQRLTIAVAACMVFLGLQLCLGVVILLVSVQGLPWGLLFLVACVAYIAYLLQSVRISVFKWLVGFLFMMSPFKLQICDFTRMNMTTCNYGKVPNKSTMQRTVMNPVATNEPQEKKKKGVKLIQLSFLEKTMSKVKLL